MSPTYLSPGVYIEEVDRGTKPIEAVGTAVAAFVGYTEFATARLRDPKKPQLLSDQDLLGKPTTITNWSQYIQKFGGFIEQAFLPDAVYGYFANGGGRCYVVSLKALGAAAPSNETGRQIEKGQITIPSIEDANTPLLEFTPKSSVTSPIGVQIKAAEPPAANAFTVVISFEGKQEIYENLTMERGDRNAAQVINQQSQYVKVKTMSRATVLPALGEFTLTSLQTMTQDTAFQPVTLKDYQGNLAERRGVEGLEPYNDITMICVPDLMTSYLSGEVDTKGVQAIQQTIIDFCERVKYCFAVLDTPPHLTPEEARMWRLNTNFDSSRAALYYPWIEVPNQTGTKATSRLVPPSGHIAGIYARNDTERGVHKAPANEVIRNSIDLEIQVTKGEQEALNPIGVNCLRAFPGRGIRVWGARTLSSNPSWRYINVRRLFSMVEASIEQGTQWVVFEPNDANLWARVRRDVGAFLKLIWRSGALFGDVPEQAFYVKCDAETNPPEVRDVGQLIIEIGMAPVKPAEFVIFRISQWAGPDSSSE